MVPYIIALVLNILHWYSKITFPLCKKPNASTVVKAPS